jgi:hypothetical protein
LLFGMIPSLFSLPAREEKLGRAAWRSVAADPRPAS